MASALVIGVGSTGLAVMEQMQQFYYEFTNKGAPINTEFLYIETDGNNIPSKMPNGTTKIKSCNVSFDNVDATLTNWHRANNPEWEKWLPTTAQVLNAHSGAGGQPVIGRVALWANEQTVLQQISAAYKNINGNTATNIYIVGSLTGGTCTGMFLDIAYMVQHVTANRNIYGMMLLPDRGGVGNRTKSGLYENAYASLRSLDRFSRANTVNNTNYQCVLPNGNNISSLSAPFYGVQFFTQDFANANASMADLSDLIQSVGFNLVLRILDISHQTAPFQDIINARLIDYTSWVPDGLFTTIGLNMFQYPEALLEEYFAIDQIENDLLKRWSDTEIYIDQNGTSQPIMGVVPKIKNDIAKFMEETIESVVERCEGNSILGSPTLKSALSQEIATIKNKNYQAPNQKSYIFSLFDANAQKANFYAAITGQAYSLRDGMVEYIAAKIDNDSTEYQNLTIVQSELNELVTSIDNLIIDWNRRLKIDGTPAQWSKTWQKMLPEAFGSEAIYTGFFAQPLFWESGLHEVAKLCYYHTAIPILESICKSIKGIDGISAIVSTNNITLPTLAEYGRIADKVQDLLNLTENESIVTRKNNIGGQLKQTNNPQINFLFQGADYKKDIETAAGKYKNTGKYLTFREISQDSLWNYFVKMEVFDLRADLIKNGLQFIQRLNLFAGSDIVSIMKNLKEDHTLYKKVNSLLKNTANVITQDVPAMVKLINSEQFTSHQCLKLIVSSALPDNNAAGIALQMIGHKPSVGNSDYVQLPSLKNTVVVYQEYGYLGQVSGIHKTFNPLIHLEYQDQVLSSIKDKIQSGGQAYNPKMRLAYIDKETVTDTNNINIK